MTAIESATGSGILAAAPISAAGLQPGRRNQSRWRSVKLGMIAVLLVLALWMVTKAGVPLNGVSIGSTQILPRTDDGSLPTPLAVLRVLGAPEVDIPGSTSTGLTILSAAWFSARLAALGFIIGTVIGAALGALMFFSKTSERALLPYVVVAPTVPVLAIAPLVAAWSGKLAIFGTPWQPWMSVALITAYLCLLPVAAGLLRGLSSPLSQSRELMHCLSASRWQVLMRLNLPTAVPFVMPALKLAAAAAVVGAIVSEISTGTNGGLGRLILDFAPEAATDGSRLYAAVIAAAILGIFATSLITVLEVALGKYQERTA